MNYFYLLVLIAIYFCFSHDSKKVKEELKNTRKELDELARSTGNPEKSPYYTEPEVKKNLVALISSGEKVRAVKILKNMKKLDLVEAKMIADSLEENQSGENF